MADDGREKRRRTSIQFESEVQRLRSENDQLHRRIRQLEGNHEVLPVSLAPPVDLPRVDTSIVAHITSFIGESRELLNLALTCKSFGWRQPTSILNLSLVDEVARQVVCSRATDPEKNYLHLPPYASGTTTWLTILNRFEHLLLFDDVLLGVWIEHENGDPTAVRGTYDDIGDGDYFKCTAVSSGHVMKSGIHYAEFNVTGYTSYIGIVRPMPGLDVGRYQEGVCHFIDSEHKRDFLAQRSDDWGSSNVHACELDVSSGMLSWTDWGERGHEGSRDLDYGLDCDGSTISIVLNLNEGTMTASGPYFLLKDGLSGPYCWYASVGTRGDAVSIKRGTPPRCRCGVTS